MDIPLILAVIHNHTDAVTLLLNKGADIDRKYVMNGRTALHHATRAGTLDMMVLLLDNYANPNIYDDYNMTPLLIAVTRTLIDMERINILVKYGADMTMQDSDGRTPLYIAISRHNADMIELLLRISDDPIKLLNIKDNAGYKPLLLAIHNGANEHILDLLCRPGAEGSILHGLAHTNYIKEVRYLLRKRHDPNEKNDSGLTPLHIAIINKNYDMMQLLIDGGANVHIANNDGLTALEMAKEQGVLIYGH